MTPTETWSRSMNAPTPDASRYQAAVATPRRDVGASTLEKLATLGTAMGALSKTMQWRLHNSARATAAGVQDVVTHRSLALVPKPCWRHHPKDQSKNGL